MGSLITNLKNGKLRLGKERQINGKQYNLNLDYQTLKKAHFWVKQKIADENVKWEILVKILKKIGGYLHENWENPHSGNFSPTFIEDNNVVFGLGTFPHLHTFLRRLPYKH